MDLSQTPVWIQAIVLGLVQGIAEFLPISSSGHLVLIPELTHWKHLGKEFDVALHLGTLMAIVAYFREDVRLLFRGLFDLVAKHKIVLAGRINELDFPTRLVYMIIVASIPAGILGLTLEKWLEKHFDKMAPIAFWLAVVAVLMYWAERRGSQRYELTDLTVHGAAMIGGAQACALMPGVSRSGSTMTMALLLGLTRAEAARFSFLMALPITAAACFLKGLKTIKAVAETGDTSFLVPCVIGIVVSGISGWLCIHFLMRYLRTNTFTPFVIYRLLLAVVLVVWMITH
jgi:undecaprenyl-diphosphatase